MSILTEQDRERLVAVLGREPEPSEPLLSLIIEAVYVVAVFGPMKD